MESSSFINASDLCDTARTELEDASGSTHGTLLGCKVELSETEAVRGWNRKQKNVSWEWMSAMPAIWIVESLVLLVQLLEMCR